jgi:hypothetical protein
VGYGTVWRSHFRRQQVAWRSRILRKLDSQRLCVLTEHSWCQSNSDTVARCDCCLCAYTQRYTAARGIEAAAIFSPWTSSGT